ncbi:MAG TPA: TonB family protein [Candidatus Solibacter sp.]|nr:TonB family protein [Candidatus Solibacter sp.]
MLDLKPRTIGSTSREQVPVEKKQPRRLLLALVILVVALAAVVVRDHSFWFGADESSLDSDGSANDTTQLPIPQAPAPRQQAVQQPPAVQQNVQQQKVQRPAQQPVAKSLAPAQSTKPVAPATRLASSHESKKSVAVAANAPAQAPAAAPAPAPASNEQSVVRTVLPPLDFEVVAGDKHSTVRPGTNATKVEILKPGATPSKSAAPALSTPTNAAERERITTNVPTSPSTPTSAYPLLAQRMNVQGSVVLQALIGADGVIEHLHVLSGPSILTSAAQQAIREWHFKPYLQNGQAVETEAKITVNFNIKIADPTSKEQVSENIILVGPGSGY